MDPQETDSSVDGGLLPGQSPPFSIVTDSNHSGILLIATALCLIIAFVSILIRLFIRLGFRSEFAKDDIACFGSMVLNPFTSVPIELAAHSFSDLCHYSSDPYLCSDIERLW